MPPVSHPHAGNLLKNIKRRGLRVERVLPIHGRPVPFGELVSAMKTSPHPIEAMHYRIENRSTTQSHVFRRSVDVRPQR